MGLSKATKMLILLGIDTAFFLVEIVVGYSVHSLALVADAFHMLNDVLSLCVGLWAVRTANSKTSSNTYTYGWQRAETLGALVNGVFLVALCLSIFLEAIQRFVQPQEVDKPVLVLIVGCCGLASNILGLFLFNEHGHGHSHGHGQSEHAHDRSQEATVEEGHGHLNFSSGINDHQVADKSHNIADALPQQIVAGWPITTSADPKKNSGSVGGSPAITEGAASPTLRRASMDRKRRRMSGSRHRFTNAEDIQIHPASLRNGIINASRFGDIDEDGDVDDDAEDDPIIEPPTEVAPLVLSNNGYGTTSGADNKRQPPVEHTEHRHRQPKDTSKSSHGHSHGDLNMRGVFLHVLGDALGNIGVIASALFIWLTNFSWRFYSDPLMSLIITVIILCSAIPLCRAASRILLQAVPAGISIDDIKADISDLPGIKSCHHVHVWQLTDTNLVASLHIELDFELKDDASERYMRLAKAIHVCLHEHGIDSSTIQPEFYTDSQRRALESRNSSEGSSTAAASTENRTDNPAATSGSPEACLLECDEECGGPASQCCKTPPEEPNPHAGHHH